jgi:uncharacterized protein
MNQVLTSILLSLQTGFFMFWDTLWPLVLGFALSGAVQAFVSRSEMQRLLGDHRPRTLARASFFGMVSSSCSYAAAAMGKSLFEKGADFTTTVVFMIASTNLVLELALVLWILIGWQFAAAEYVGGIVMIGLFALIARFLLKPRLIDIAREHINSRPAVLTGHEHHGQPSESSVPFRRRVTSVAGWAEAASAMMADLIMIRKELVTGYVVAGFLAVIVPSSIWNVLFFHGHGAWTSLENVLVGPLIAVISFVCSIGNVPLAAALWTGGISFGGVVSFIFGDLITMPLLLIYRKYYGWALTWRLALGLWAVMSVAGLVTELLFGAVGGIPSTRPIQAIVVGFQWNYTTFLNLVAIAVFAVLFWLYRNRDRLGEYATDPVCGMQVERASATTTIEHHGKKLYFCSTGCRDEFVRDPDRYLKQGAQSEAVAPTGHEGHPH